jgi:hypothetical protein
MGPYAGLALSYEIGTDEHSAGRPDRIIEVGFGKPPVKGGPCIAYGNFLDQREVRECGPYLEATGTADEYDEGVPDPKGPGFEKNLRLQFEKARAQGHTDIEIDNPDDEHFSTADIIKGIELAGHHGLGVIAKNPGLLNDGGALQYVGHDNVHGIVIEDGAGNAADNDDIRKRAGKPGLPMWFVFHGEGERAAAIRRTAEIVKQNIRNASVTLDTAADEYGGEIEHFLLPIKTEDNPMAWRVAKSLETLRDQVNAKWPNRDKSSDGTIGDAAHQATNSDHNPNSAGVVTALDITHDPAHGLDARKLAETLVASRDPRIKYIISNGQIVSSVVSPWQWRTYTGSNAHRAHVHISVNGSAGLYDDARAWNLGDVPVKVPGRNIGITATRFADSQVAYADVAPGWNNRMGVALPYRFKGERPKVRVFKGGKSVVCEIMDIGPWYDGTAARGPFDPYWETGSRPRAESDPKTNGAGIDLTLPADAALGLNGKGLVDWEFVSGEPKPDPVPVPDANIAAILAALKAIEARLTKLEQQPVAVGGKSEWAQVIAAIGSGLERAPEIVDAVDRLLARGPQVISMIERVGTVVERFAPLIGMFTGARFAALPVASPPPANAQPSGGVGAGTAAIAGAGGGMGFAVFALELLTKLMGGG